MHEGPGERTSKNAQREKSEAQNSERVSLNRDYCTTSELLYDDRIFRCQNVPAHERSIDTMYQRLVEHEDGHLTCPILAARRVMKSAAKRYSSREHPFVVDQ